MNQRKDHSKRHLRSVKKPKVEKYPMEDRHYGGVYPDEMWRLLSALAVVLAVIWFLYLFLNTILETFL